MTDAMLTLQMAHARLSAVLSAAMRLAEDIEEEVPAGCFDLATALQCVLKEALTLAEGMEGQLVERPQQAGGGA